MIAIFITLAWLFSMGFSSSSSSSPDTSIRKFGLLLSPLVGLERDDPQ